LRGAKRGAKPKKKEKGRTVGELAMTEGRNREKKHKRRSRERGGKGARKAN